MTATHQDSYTQRLDNVSGKLKVLFLDIDGVMNSQETLTRSTRSGSIMGIDPFMSFLVGKIKLDTGCEIVLSSSWRHMPDGVKEVESKLGKLYGMTPTSNSGIRGNEIKAWLADHPEVTRYAILDDDSDFDPDMPLFKTSFAWGLNEEIAKEVTDFLNADLEALPNADAPQSANGSDAKSNQEGGE